MSQHHGDSGHDRSGGGGPRRISPELIGWLVAAVVAVVFVVENRERTRVQFLFLDRTMRVWVVIVVSMVLGAVLGWLLPRVVRRRKKGE